MAAYLTRRISGYTENEWVRTSGQEFDQRKGEDNTELPKPDPTYFFVL
jgi:hypothetical protein